MAQYYNQQSSQSPYAANNLQFYPSSYNTGGVSGQSTPFQASYGGPQSGYPGASQGFNDNSGASYGGNSAFGGFGAASGVSGRMGEQGGLRTGWLAALGTEGYDGEPPLLEELGVNFGHIKMKVCLHSAI